MCDIWNFTRNLSRGFCESKKLQNTEPKNAAVPKIDKEIIRTNLVYVSFSVKHFKHFKQKFKFFDKTTKPWPNGNGMFQWYNTKP